MSRDPKRLTDWLALDYFERPRPLAKWRWRSLWIAAALAAIPAIVLATMVFGNFKSDVRTNALTGPASRAHAAFINDCQRCHTGSFSTIERLSPTHGESFSTPDDKCLSCHDAGIHAVDHFDKRVLPMTQSNSCARCHREHRGESLNRFDDNTCTRCHANDSPSRPLGITFAKPVASFDTHPEFGTWRSPVDRFDKFADPGKLKFSHAMHLGADQLEMMRAVATTRMKTADGRGEAGIMWVRLLQQVEQLQRNECQACHQVDSRREYYQPINYDKHCAACHWLSSPFTPPSGGWPERVIHKVREIDHVPLKHPIVGGPAQVRGELLERATRLLKETNYDPPVMAGGPQIRPGVLVRELSPGQQQFVLRMQSLGELHMARRAVASGVHQEKALWSEAGCAYCHIEDFSGPTRLIGLPAYYPTTISKRWNRIPTSPHDRAPEIVEHQSRLWFPFAKFNHNAHRSLDCSQCHKNVESSTKASDLLLPTIADCRSCHNQRDKIRSDCLTCHNYHDRGHERLPRSSNNMKNALFPER